MKKILNAIVVAASLSMSPSSSVAAADGPDNMVTKSVPFTQVCAPSKDFDKYLEKNKYTKSSIAIVSDTSGKMLMTSWVGFENDVKKVIFLLTVVNDRGQLVTCSLIKVDDVSNIDREPLRQNEKEM